MCCFFFKEKKHRKSVKCKKREKKSTDKLILPFQTDVQHLNVTDVQTPPIRSSLLFKALVVVVVIVLRKGVCVCVWASALDGPLVSMNVEE